jgi:hypothetical protein
MTARRRRFRSGSSGGSLEGDPPLCSEAAARPEALFFLFCLPFLIFLAMKFCLPFLIFLAMKFSYCSNSSRVASGTDSGCQAAHPRHRTRTM